MNYHITRLVIVCGHFSRKKCEKFRVEPFTPVYLLAFDSFSDRTKCQIAPRFEIIKVMDSTFLTFSDRNLKVC